MACTDCLKCEMLPQRVITCIMGFLSVVVAYTMRSCLSVAITEMVVPVASLKSGNSSLVCDVVYLPTNNGLNDDRNENTNDTVQYHWTQKQQGYILSSFSIGYLIAHIPGGLLAQAFGGKWTLSLGIMLIAISNVSIPLIRHLDEDNAIFMLVALLIVMGLAAGTTMPSLVTLLASWVPERERSKLGGFVLGGSQIGTVISLYGSGLLLSHWQWPVVFYFWSSIAVIWFIIFSLICYSNPSSHPFITKKELSYLKKEIGQIKRQENLPSTPWSSMLKSSPVLALICGQMGHDWLAYIMASDLPKYMKEVLNFPVHDVGLYSALPYLLMWTVSVIAGFLSDYLINGGYITITQARKIFTAFASIFPAIFVLVASYAGCNRQLVVMSFILSMGFIGNYYPSMKVNSLDLSPNYAGSLMALANGLGAITGIAAPTFVGFMTPNSSIEQWRFVFWVTFVVEMTRTTIYSIWASAEIQPWNNAKNATILAEDIDLTEQLINKPKNHQDSPH